MIWRESDHPRDGEGQFAERGTGWAQRLSAAIDAARPNGRALLVRSDTDPAELDDGPPATDVRGQYMRRVASDYRTLPAGTVTILTAHDRDGAIVGAMSVIDYPDRDHPNMVIGHVGALEGSGAGTKLVRAAVSLALSRDRDLLYTEPTENAAPFWDRMGFEPDPADVGTYYHGIAGRDALFDWLEAHP